jgi:epsilon-lactone hydrolase
MDDQIGLVRDLLSRRAGAEATWAERRAQMDAFGARAPLAPGWDVSPVHVGCPAERHTGPGVAEGRTLLYLHGGGYCLGSPVSHRGLVSQLCAASGATGYALDYRLAPEHPFPAAIDDAVAAWAAVLASGVDPSRAVIAGDSAGGGLALACALRLKSAGAPLPAGLVLMSPWLNLGLEGESFARCADADPMVSKSGLEQFAVSYIGSGSRDEVLASPLFGDLGGLPPVLVQVGTDEVLLSDSQSFADYARAAGIDFAVEIWPRMIHVFQAFYPILDAARDAIDGAGAWIARRTPA